MDEVFGDVVACHPVDEVSMGVYKGKVTVRFIVPQTDPWATYKLETDFDTARRMVEGDVSVLVVVSDRKREAEEAA